MTVVAHKECRALRHAWTRRPGPPDGWTRPYSPAWLGARYIVHLQCMRCETWRQLAVTERGGRLASSYTYVDDYLMPRGEPRVDPDKLRLWLAVPSRWER
jgi:hypothetical protein